jgi:methyl-accepting chemotaxis protein
MRTRLFYLRPVVAGLVPALICVGTVLASGETATGLAGACAASALAGAATFFGLGRGWLDQAARTLEQAVESGARNRFADPLAAPPKPLARLVAPLERLRATVRQRETDLLADIEARAADAERRKKVADAEAQGYIEAHEVFMKTFTAALTAMANGDLSVRLETPFSRDYEALRRCFNDSIDGLNAAFAGAAHGVAGIRGAAHAIADAMTELSERTGRQAASVEEATASLRGIVDAVGRTATEAKSAAEAVAATRGRAEIGAEVVARAIEAMRRIQNSAGEIEKIIGVIDEIAFQTNLLALNAGVEAARAGDAGKGFAVVASEVRALALRSAEAAKEIKTLIAVSGAQVKEGVDLVGETGASLESIVGLVGAANATVATIADGAAEQKSMLDSVDEAMRRLDSFTQQNAAMVEGAHRSGQALRDKAAEIAEAVSRFRLREALRRAA